MFIKEEFPVQYWGDYSEPGDESFWIKDAMTAALGMLWYNHYRETLIPDNVLLILDRERGVAIASVVVE